MIKCRLSTIMGERRLKVADVARGADLHRNVVTRYYKDQGIDMMSKDVLNKLCSFLNVPVGELIVWEPKQRKEREEKPPKHSPEEFEKIAAYVMDKNAELYRRLS